jgi:hypothetical protein
MIDKWKNWYKREKSPSMKRYGGIQTYQLAEEFLKDLDVEDWGCGLCGFKILHMGGYLGVDGTKTPFTDKVVDLREYRSNVEGIMMRHVLEHNYDWRKVLDNATQSFTKRMCLVLFTPFQKETKVMAQNIGHGVDVPDIGFKQEDINEYLEKFKWHMDTVESKCHYGIEYIYYIEK